MDHDLESIAKTLADGFNALAEEYKFLAEKHELLERKLSVAKLQIENIRCLLPSEKDQSLFEATANEHTNLLQVSSTRNLDTWLQYMSDRGLVKDLQAPGIVHSAQITKFKLSNRPRPDRKAGRRVDGQALRASRPQSRAASQPPIPEVAEPPMEQDFTEFNTPGELGCPFAKKHASLAQRSADIPTPQGSASYNPVMSGPRSKRTSFVDPLRPEVKQAEPISPAPSAVDSTGVACPIRFLNDHAPEDIANYFEKHKHELPRSHELCITRFQSNQDTVRELDQKYGNLVTMIQGLGKKHQPMLPEVPNVEPSGDVSEEQQRVKKWAASINEAAGQDGGPQGGTPASNEPEPAIDSSDENRVSHFDRPLKEIRVGESPSRPWGVKIPAKYLDRDDASSTSSAPVAAVASVSPYREEQKPQLKYEKEYTPSNTQDNTHSAAATKAKNYSNALTDATAPIAANNILDTPNHDTRTTAAIPASTKQPRGKCPFDHKALAAQQQKQPNPTKIELGNGTAVPAATIATTAQQGEHDKANPIQQCLEPKLINEGITVVSDRSQLPEQGFMNRGVLILGFGESSAKELLTAAQEMNRKPPC